MPPDQNHYGNNQQGNSSPEGGQQSSQQAPAKEPSFFESLAKKFGNQATPPIQQPTNQGNNPEPPKVETNFLEQLFSQKPVEQETVDPSKVVDPFAVNQEGLQEKFGSLNVAQYIEPELMTKAMAGDVDAFTQVLNRASSISAMAAFSQAAQMAKSGVTTHLKGMEDALPNKFRDMNLDTSIDTHPEYSKPHMKPVAQALRKEFLSRYPQASNSEVIQLIDNYFKEVGGEKPPAPTKDSTSSGSKTNFDDLFSQVLSGK